MLNEPCIGRRRRQAGERNGGVVTGDGEARPACPRTSPRLDGDFFVRAGGCLHLRVGLLQLRGRGIGVDLLFGIGERGLIGLRVALRLAGLLQGGLIGRDRSIIGLRLFLEVLNEGIVAGLGHSGFFCAALRAMSSTTPRC